MGNKICVPNLTKQSQCGRVDGISYAASSMQGWREENEDEILIHTDLSDGNSIYAVFDGHGGSEASKFVANHFKQFLTTNSNYKSGDYEKALSETFLRIDDVMTKPNARREMEASSTKKTNHYTTPIYGTAAIVTLITKDIIYVANAGDSRAVVCKGFRHFELMSEDHKPTLPKELERIENAGGHVKDGRINGCLSVSRGLGDFLFKQNLAKGPLEQQVSPQPEIRQIKKSEVEFMLIACDGVWECISSSILMSCIQSKLKISSEPQQLKQIIEDVFHKLVAPSPDFPKGFDNMSAVLIVF